MFNYLYCDVLALFDPHILKQLTSETPSIDGIIFDDNFLLSAAILMEIPIAMVILSRVLIYKTNRWANIIAGTIKTVIMIITLFVGDGPSRYYLFFGIIEIVTTAWIVFYAWNWREHAHQ